MLQKWSRYKLLQVFFDYPRQEFLVRELSRKIKLAQTSTTNHIKALRSEGLIKKSEGKPYPTFSANRDNHNYKLLKTQNLIINIHKSGLVDFIENHVRPNCIVLFGSGSRGEDIQTSDVDLFVQAKEVDLDLSSFERKLNRTISLFFESNTQKLSHELFNNINNGIILAGYLEVVR